MFLPICTGWIRFLHSTMFLLIRWKHWLTGARTSTFTFHNVSINTDTQKFAFLFEFEFTFHNVSINTIVIHQMSIHISYLHSTMFLLILFYGDDIINMIAGFTFHNVSINTGLSGCPWFSLPSLHSTMFLLIPTCSRFYISTASLYIPQCFY